MNPSMRDLFVLTHGFESKGKLTAVLYGFFDGSSTHAGSKIWTLCGFLGNLNEFQEFDGKWQAVLNKRDWPNRPKEFHMYDCVHAVGEFEGWRFAERLALFGDLSNIVADSGLFALGSIVIVNDLERLSSEELELLNSEGLGNPIDLTMQYIIQNSLRYARERSASEEIGLMFDRENPEAAQRILAFSEHYRKEFGNVLAGIAFGESEKWTPIQAADMLAYCTYRLELRRRFLGEAEPDLPVLPCFARLILQISPNGGGYDIDSMRRLVDLIKNKPKGNFSI